MKSVINIASVAVLIGIFLCSVLVRLPNINRPLSKHHEFATAISVRVISIWYYDGILKYGLNPVMNYAGKLNKHINNHASTTGGIKDMEGNYYYISHPPFAFILPFIIHRVLQIEPTVLSVQVFHLCINFISALFIYLIICILLKNEFSVKIFLPALIGYVIYLFNPAVLWFQCNTYMSDMLVQMFFIICIYLILKILSMKDVKSNSHLLLFSGSLFLMIYTSWLGVFFALTVVSYSAWKFKNGLVYKKLIFAGVLPLVAGLALIVWQYSQIAGGEALWEQFVNRIGERSLPEGSEENYFITILKSIQKIGFTYLSSYSSLFVILIIFGWIWIKRQGSKKLKLAITREFMIFSILPIVALNILLLNYSGHDFVSLYASLFLSVFFAVIFYRIAEEGIVKLKYLLVGVAVHTVFSIAIYYLVNKPGKYSFNGDKYSQGMEIAKYINNNAKDDEVIFYSGSYPVYPEITLYAERNIKQIKDEQEGIDFMKTHSIRKAFWFHVDDERRLSHESLIIE